MGAAIGIYLSMLAIAHAESTLERTNDPIAQLYR